MAEKNKIDVVAVDQGTTWVFTPVTERAQKIFAEKVQSESWQWAGRSLCVDWRMGQSLIEVLTNNEGLVLK